MSEPGGVAGDLHGDADDGDGTLLADLDDDLDDDDLDDGDLDDGDGNRIVGAVPRAVLEHVARSLVDDPDAVVVECEERRSGGVMLRLHVSPDDMGKVIGRRGRIAQAIRTLVRAAGSREGVDAQVDIVE